MDALKELFQDCFYNGVQLECNFDDWWEKNKNQRIMKHERYDMCKDQPAQIDCRETKCTFHKNGSCTNISPAITLMDSLVVVQQW